MIGIAAAAAAAIVVLADGLEECRVTPRVVQVTLAAFPRELANVIEPLRCPKCIEPLERVGILEWVVDRCTGCGGMWFDADELDVVRALPGAEAADTGDPAVGARLDALRTIDCPRCDSRMVQRVDAERPDVHYEQCSSCGGIFLDAGELRALSSAGLAGWLKRVFG